MERALLSPLRWKKRAIPMLHLSSLLILITFFTCFESSSASKTQPQRDLRIPPNTFCSRRDGL